ncbi:unnamed protein product, partial [Heligmosomoides polygyrus]|uniref:CASP-like protein n=1 Tax=Heligmosomoides polygyrus TaxID=6339 RepID=A0A183GH03_HELPZ
SHCLLFDAAFSKGGISNACKSVNSPGASHSSGSTTNSGASAMVGSLFGNTCFKACGIEDIQYAARSAGDMLITMRFCVVASTVVFLLCLVILTGAVLPLQSHLSSDQVEWFSYPGFFQK